MNRRTSARGAGPIVASAKDGREFAGDCRSEPWEQLAGDDATDGCTEKRNREKSLCSTYSTHFHITPTSRPLFLSDLFSDGKTGPVFFLVCRRRPVGIKLFQDTFRISRIAGQSTAECLDDSGIKLRPRACFQLQDSLPRRPALAIWTISHNGIVRRIGFRNSRPPQPLAKRRSS